MQFGESASSSTYLLCAKSSSLPGEGSVSESKTSLLFVVLPSTEGHTQSIRGIQKWKAGSLSNVIAQSMCRHRHIIAILQPLISWVSDFYILWVTAEPSGATVGLKRGEAAGGKHSSGHQPYHIRLIVQQHSTRP